MEVSAKLSNAPLSAQKGRLIADQIRGLNVEKALQVLTFSPKKAAHLVKKVLVRDRRAVDEVIVIIIAQQLQPPQLTRRNERPGFTAVIIIDTMARIPLAFSPNPCRRTLTDILSRT